MISLIFRLGNEIVEIRIDGETILFRKQNSEYGFTTIDNLRLSKEGAIREFPDLKDNENWKNITIERFKDKIKNMKTEIERANYVIEDLRKYGYKPMYMQRKGFRVKKIKWEILL